VVLAQRRAPGAAQHGERAALRLPEDSLFVEREELVVLHDEPARDDRVANVAGSCRIHDVADQAMARPEVGAAGIEEDYVGRGARGDDAARLEAQGPRAVSLREGSRPCLPEPARSLAVLKNPAPCR